MQLPILTLVKTDYEKLSRAEQQLLAVAAVSEPNLGLLKREIPPTRNLQHAKKDAMMRERKAELEAAVENLLKQGWLTRTMTGSVALTKDGRRCYLKYLEGLRVGGKLF